MSQLKKVQPRGNQGVDFEEISKSEKFGELMNEKKRFLVPLTIFFLVFYFMLPILTSYSTILNRTAIGPITWTWVYAFAQFIMTWVLCMMYVRKATRFDQMADEIVHDYTKIEGESK
jgi:uncharacterized membrane protein (DUF485 family)